jgi:hypothetical protein
VHAVGFDPAGGEARGSPHQRIRSLGGGGATTKNSICGGWLTVRFNPLGHIAFKESHDTGNLNITISAVSYTELAEETVTQILVILVSISGPVSQAAVIARTR